MTSDGRGDVITATIAEVNEMSLGPADRSIVLEALLRARLGGEATVEAPTLGGRAGTEAAAQRHRESDVFGELMRALELSRDTLEMIYDVVDNEPTLVVSAKKIATNKSQAVRQLGQLIATGRQLAGIEEWTPASVIRKVVQDYGRLDSSNFAASLQQMEGVAVLRGKGATREVKITKPGIESAAELIKTLTGEE